MKALGVGSTVVAGYPVTASASGWEKLENVKFGQQRIVSLKVTHEPHLNPVAVDSGRKSLRVEGNRLFVVGGRTTPFKEPSTPVLQSPAGVTSSPSSLEYRQEAVQLKTSFDGVAPTLASVESAYEPLHIEIETEQSTSTISVAGDQTFEVSRNNVTEQKLSSKTVEVPTYGEPVTREFERPEETINRTIRPRTGTKTTDVTPTVTARDHGLVNVFAYENGPIGPRAAPWMQRLLPSREDDERQIISVENSNLVAISTEGVQ